MRRRRYYNPSIRYTTAATRRSGNGMKLGLIFAALIGVNVYVFFFRGGTSVGDLMKKEQQAAAAPQKPGPNKQQASLPALSTSKRLVRPEDVPGIVIKGSMKGHIGLAPALQAIKLTPEAAEEIVGALRGKLDMRRLQARHTFELVLDRATNQVRQFTYHLTQVRQVVAKRQGNGKLSAKVVEQRLEKRTIKVAGRIKTSLHQAIADTGESAKALLPQFVELFAWDVNWAADPRPGDEIRLIVEKQYLRGEFYRYGKIIAAEYRGELGRKQVFWFKQKNGRDGYYTPEGRSVRRSFLKTPLHYRRISSKFSNKRFHPILHRSKKHNGVDYAAPTGTPVWAAASGTVTFARRAGGAGKMVKIKHGGGMATLYMHLSRIARGMRRGRKVQQREVIGYVGATGLATGPHLHYGMTRRGRHVDPLKFPIPRGPLLPHAERHRFLDGLKARMAGLEAIQPKAAKTANAAGDKVKRTGS